MDGYEPRHHDVLIVGGGSAGSVLAARLSEDPGRSVLLLEAGQAYEDDAYPEVLLDSGRVGGDPETTWGYTARAGRRAPRIDMPRGKTLGGSSALNATVAAHVRRTDLAAWAAHGVEGWTADAVLATSRRLENTESGLDEFHGRTGPLPVRQRSYAEVTPSIRAFVDAAVLEGFDRVEDANGATQRGVSLAALTAVDGRRQNTGLVYLTADVRRRPNLTVRGDVTVDRVLFDGDTATGVVDLDGTVHTGGEVILSAGAVGSPAILLRSGVGPTEDLDALGIDVVADLPVGRRLQDHPIFYTVYALTPDALAMTPPVGALLWTASSEAEGDELDLHVSVTHLIDGSVSPTGGAIVLAVALVRPESRGTLRIGSRDPKDAPAIDLNFLDTARDRRRLLEGVTISRAVARNPVFAAVTAGELVPGDAVRTDDELMDAIETSVNSYAHPTATAPMGGAQDPWAVVDSLGAVRNVTGLRVIDASIMPEVPSAATNLITITIAERLAETLYRG